MTQESNNKNLLVLKELPELADKINAVFFDFPIELQQRILDTEQEKLRTFFMIQGWANDNQNDALKSLLIDQIAQSERNINKLNEELNNE